MDTQDAAIPVLAVENLKVFLENREVIRGFSCELRTGERVGVMGPSGSGKTTLLRAIAGLVDASAGTVVLHGKPPAAWGWPKYRRRVLLAAQRPALLHGTVHDNLARPFSYAAAGSRFDPARAAALLERLGVGRDCLDHEAHALSVGQQQRVCLARALLLEPEVLLLDEPTSALDEGAEAAVEAILREEMAARNACALIVSHDPAQVARWCQRSIMLEDGRGVSRHE